MANAAAAAVESVNVADDTAIAEAVANAKREADAEHQASLAALQQKLDLAQAATPSAAAKVQDADVSAEPEIAKLNDTIAELRAQLANAAAAAVESVNVADDTTIAAAVEIAKREVDAKHMTRIATLQQDLEVAQAAALLNSSDNVSFLEQVNESNLGSAAAKQKDGRTSADSSKSRVSILDDTVIITEAVTKAKIEAKAEYETRLAALQQKLDLAQAATPSASAKVQDADASAEPEIAKLKDTIAELREQLANAAAAAVEPGNVADNTAIAEAVANAKREADVALEDVKAQLASALVENAEVVAELDLSEKKTLNLVAEMEHASELTRKLEETENMERARQELDAALAAKEAELVEKAARTLDKAIAKAAAERALAIAAAITQAQTIANESAEEAQKVHVEELSSAVSAAVVQTRKKYENELVALKHKAIEDTAKAVATARVTQHEETIRDLEQKHQDTLSTTLGESQEVAAKSKAAALHELSVLHVEEIAGLEATHDNILGDLKTLHATAMDDITLTIKESAKHEFDTVLAAREETHARQMLVTTEEHARLMAQKQEAYTDLELAMATAIEQEQLQAKSKLEKCEALYAANIEARESSITTEVENAKSAKREFDAMLAAQEEAHARQMVEMTEEHASLLAQKQKAYMEFEQAMVATVEKVQSQAQTELEQRDASTPPM